MTSGQGTYNLGTLEAQGEAGSLIDLRAAPPLGTRRCGCVMQVYDEFRQRYYDSGLTVRATDLPDETTPSGAQIRWLGAPAVETGPAAAHQLVGLRRQAIGIDASARFS